ncbi:hypothetical protein ACIOZM_19920 [Pseudomonas sp. NPDC087346]|uniref:hypothetical protein n=1 Tax=Pseudomonas sp. NPDC087346 TaxID=3364438 RepID=UPI00382981F7
MSSITHTQCSSARLDLSVLPAPLIPALVRPIDGDEGYHGGLGANAQSTDLLVIVDPWLDMRIGQKCLFYWGDDVAPVKTEIIDTPEKLNKPLQFLVPANQLLNGRVFPVFYRVVRSSGNEAESGKLSILIKFTKPGGVLLKPEPLGHPELRYAFIPDIKDGVDAESAEKGITLLIAPYPNMTIFDRIVARWGNAERVDFYPVTADQIDDPKNHPILIMFDKTLIKRAGNGVHAVTYQVIDRCGNRPDDKAPWAIATDVQVNLDRIPPPMIEDTEEGVLDPAYVKAPQVIVSGMGLIAGNRVRVHWQGREERETQSQVYTGVGEMRFAIPLAWANESNEHAVAVTSKVERNGMEITSDPTPIFIKTTIVLTLPEVLEAYGTSGELLKMDDIYRATHVTVEIPEFLGMAVGQSIRLRWTHSRFTYDSAITTVDNVGPMQFLIPRMEVVDAIGSAVNISFTLRTFPAGPLHRSVVFKLTIEPQQFVLTPPRLTPDQRTITVRYTGMVTGYHARVRIVGVSKEDTPWMNLTTGVTAEFAVPPEWITANKGKAVLFNYCINRLGVSENSQFAQMLRIVLPNDTSSTEPLRLNIDHPGDASAQEIA